MSVRPLAPPEFDQFVSYWLNLSPEEVGRLGVAKERLPSREAMIAGLERMLATPADPTFVLAWCVNGETIGHSSLKEIVQGETANMHLHMWRPHLRGKGFGPALFCMSAIDFYERFALKQIFCEPKAENPGPNRMLQRVGFPMVGQRVGAASDISAVSTLNRYLIRRDVAETYLVK